MQLSTYACFETHNPPNSHFQTHESTYYVNTTPTTLLFNICNATIYLSCLRFLTPVFQNRSKDLVGSNVRFLRKPCVTTWHNNFKNTRFGRLQQCGRMKVMAWQLMQPKPTGFRVFSIFKHPILMIRASHSASNHST